MNSIPCATCTKIAEIFSGDCSGLDFDGNTEYTIRCVHCGDIDEHTSEARVIKSWYAESARPMPITIHTERPA